MYPIPVCDGDLIFPSGGLPIECDGEWFQEFVVGVPVLAPADVGALFAAVCALWALAWVFRWLLRELKRS